MITQAQAEQFTQSWIDAWNAHDLEAILGLYDEELDYASEKIAALGLKPDGKLTSKAEVNAYFQRGLEVYPDLHFKLQQVYFGVNTIVIVYLSMNDVPAAEVFELNNEGLIIRVYCNYGR